MNKTFLVALREYVDFLRTKTFWIGIASFPALILVAVVVSRVLREAKDVRTYAVVDYSEGRWLSEAIEERAATGEFERILAEIADVKTLAETRAQVLEQLKRRRAGFRGTEIQKEFLDQLIETIESAEPGEQLDAALQAWFSSWLAGKSERELAGLKTDLDRDRWRRMPAGPPGEETEAELNRELQRGKLFAYFVIPPDPVETDEGSRYVSNNLTDNELRNWFTRHATAIVRARRIEELELSEQQARSILSGFSFHSRKVSEETGEVEEVGKTETVFQFAPVVFVYLLWVAIMMATQMLLTNTIEEKSNRIIEVLLSSVSPLQLMSGKIFGIAATGLTLVLFWVLCALAGVAVLPAFVPQAAGLSAIVGDPLYLASFFGYFLGGYFFFAALLVGVGAVCNSLKEAQNLQSPIFMLLIVPLLAMVPVVNDPNGTLARVLTYVPPFTPFLMMNRAGGPPPAWEYAASTVVIAVSIVVAFWAAAKVFRVGILMTGKPPRLGEILRWLRTPVGSVPVRREHR